MREDDCSASARVCLGRGVFTWGRFLRFADLGAPMGMGCILDGGNGKKYNFYRVFVLGF